MVEESESTLAKETPPKFEERGQTVQEELQEVILGSDEEPRPSNQRKYVPQRKKKHIEFLNRIEICSSSYIPKFPAV